MLRGLFVIIVWLAIIILVLGIFPCKTDSNEVLPEEKNDREKTILLPLATLKPALKLYTHTSFQPKISSKPEPSEIPFSQLAPTTTMSFEELVGDDGIYGAILSPPPKDTYKIVVNVKYQFIAVFRKDEKGEFNIPVRYMLCSTGKASTPTPIGSFETGGDTERFTQFSGNMLWAQYWTQLVDDIYFHSVLYSEKDANFYTNSYTKLGTRASHGCIRLPVPDARWIYFHIASGTKVEIIEGTEDEKAAKIREQLVLPPYPESRVTLIMGEIPITEPWPDYRSCQTKTALEMQN